MKILCVEDNQQLAEQLRDALMAQRYVVDVAVNGQEGWDLARMINYDLLVLDVSLPQLDGISLCRQLRARGYSMPILLLTGNGTGHDKITGLDAGADDYLVKPVDLEELMARIRALFRRKCTVSSSVLMWGKLCLNSISHQVTFDDRPLSLTPKEYTILEIFLCNGQRIHSRRSLIDQAWSCNEDIPGEDTVKAHIKGLRRKLKASGADNLIETVYGVGYRLNTKYLPSTEMQM